MNESKVRELFSNIKMLVETCADFSNGNICHGWDEGKVRGWECWDGYMKEAEALGLIDVTIASSDPRVEEVIKVAESLCLAFNEIVGTEEGEITDNTSGKSVNCTTYVLSFVDPGGTFIEGHLLLFHGQFEHPNRKGASGWLRWVDSERPEIRVLSETNEAVVIDPTTDAMF